MKVLRTEGQTNGIPILPAPSASRSRIKKSVGHKPHGQKPTYMHNYVLN